MPIFLEGAVGCAESKVPKWTNKSKSFEGEVWLKHFQCAVCAELRVGLKFQQIYYWCSLCRCLGENWFIVRCHFLWTKSPTENSNVHVEWEWVWWLISFLSVAYWVQECLQWMDGEDWGDSWIQKEVAITLFNWSANHAGRWLASPIAGWLW
jgi:hypothetical protein